MKIEIGKISGSVLWLLLKRDAPGEGEFPVEDALRNALLLWSNRDEEDVLRHGKGIKHLELEIPVLTPHQALVAGISLQKRMIRFVESAFTAIADCDRALFYDLKLATEILAAIAVAVQERTLLDLTRVFKAPTN